MVVLNFLLAGVIFISCECNAEELNPVSQNNNPAKSDTVQVKSYGNYSSTQLPESGKPGNQSAVGEEVLSSNEPSEDNFKSAKIVGEVGTYTVKKHENIRLVAAKLGVTREQLIKMNGLSPKSSLKPGQELSYNNRKIIPKTVNYGIIINIPDKTIYYFKNGKIQRVLPVALGVPVKNKKYDWETPTGRFKIVAKIKNPKWTVPPSIQDEMEEKGETVITEVPPGPKNPLGHYAMRTSLPGILIHSTTSPGSVYSFASHGCIRVYPTEMESFFKEVAVRTPGEIIYRPVKLAVTENGRIFLEVHKDVYRMAKNLNIEAKRLIEKENLADRVDWNKVNSVIKKKDGVAEDITL